MSGSNLPVAHQRGSRKKALCSRLVGFVEVQLEVASNLSLELSPMLFAKYPSVNGSRVGCVPFPSVPSRPSALNCSPANPSEQAGYQKQEGGEWASRSPETAQQVSGQQGVTSAKCRLAFQVNCVSRLNIGKAALSILKVARLVSMIALLAASAKSATTNRSGFI